MAIRVSQCKAGHFVEHVIAAMKVTTNYLCKLGGALSAERRRIA
jgi:hypothetical protein